MAGGDFYSRMRESGICRRSIRWGLNHRSSSDGVAGVSDSATGTALARVRLSERLRKGDRAARVAANEERFSRVFIADGDMKIGIVD